MHMRLGFAVASHVEADRLLLDEVLAVGDVAFQEKCGAWLADLKRRGVSALVVSHDPATLAHVCDRVAWLDRGRVVDAGDPAAIAGRYEHDLRARSPR
jgi:ABC-type polysaccharide/polyol phosphate transport system ATPase subunit